MPLPLATTELEGFEHMAVALGGLLVLGALLSGVARRTFLSMTPVFLLAGFLLGDGGAGFIELEAESPFVGTVAAIALIALLFRDGLEVDAELLQRASRPPLAKLLVGMPITLVLVSWFVHLVTDLGWELSFLLGALLTPTDPVLSSAVVTDPRVPGKVRHSLNLESGLNDGLALPAVLTFAALVADADDFVWWQFALEDVGLGVLVGLAVGALGSVLLPRRASVPDHQKSLYALGIAFATYGLAVQAHGNGYIAAFCCAVVLGLRREDVGHAFEELSQDVIELIKVLAFVVFGALLTVDLLTADLLAGLAIAVFLLLVARPIAVFTALLGTGLDTPTKAFMAWFGPKGVATMAFALVLLADGVPGADRLFGIAAVVVVVSVVAHGLTDTLGAAWIAGREAPAGERDLAPVP